jgi:hypothetical protein
MFLFEHDLFGKPVPTFPDHARAALPQNMADNGAIGPIHPGEARQPFSS